MRKIIASIDIGTNSIKLVVGEFIKNTMNVLCVSEVPTKGVKKGLIVNKEELIPIIKEAFHIAEETLGIPVREVVLSIPAYLTEIMLTDGSSTITNEEHVIGHQDLIRAMHAASYNKIDVNRELISIIPTRYKVDDEIVNNPINMIGNKLSIKAILVTSSKDIVDKFLNIFDSIGINVVDVVITPLGDYSANFTKAMNNSVCAIVNLGADITTISIFNKGILMKSHVVELGGSNVDNDISYIYKITKKEAHDLKESLGLASSELASMDERITLTDRMGDKVLINQKELSEIIESRLLEILNLVKKQINLLTKKEIDNILFTGGTSELGDFNILLDKVFTKSHILGKIDVVGVRNNKFSSVVGTIKYYNGRLKLKNKEYSVFNLNELEILSGAHKKINIDENSVLGKLFGYFFDS